MKIYDTEQRRTLMKILEENADRQFSAFELIDICEKKYPSVKINTSTVYRAIGIFRRTAVPLPLYRKL